MKCNEINQLRQLTVSRAAVNRRGWFLSQRAVKLLFACNTLHISLFATIKVERKHACDASEKRWGVEGKNCIVPHSCKLIMIRRSNGNRPRKFSLRLGEPEHFNLWHWSKQKRYNQYINRDSSKEEEGDRESAYRPTTKDLRRRGESDGNGGLL